MIRYDQIGFGYASTRREDPEIRDRIRSSLGNASSVLNVGAGAGSYEPHDCFVVAAEPSSVMLRQRRDDAAPAIQCSSHPLPFSDATFDAAMAVLTIHHWDSDQEAGVKEMRRVARGPVVIVTYDATVEREMWLIRDYLPEVAELDMTIFPSIMEVALWLGRHVEVHALPISRGTPDWSLGSFWAHPERVFDSKARAATSGFARQPEFVTNRVLHTLRRDLNSGEWDRRNGDLHGLEALDVGLRLIVGRP